MVHRRDSRTGWRGVGVVLAVAVWLHVTSAPAAVEVERGQQKSAKRYFALPLQYRDVDRRPLQRRHMMKAGQTLNGSQYILDKGTSREMGARRNATITLHGAVKDFGYFYSSLYLGTPPKKFSVIVDTGSTMTYVPCSTCGKRCGPNHQDSSFDPGASSTAVRISCHSDDCKCGSPICACSKDEECMYSRSYAEQSSSTGVLLEDVLALHDGGPGVRVAFGCETRETGEIYNQRADGLFGLGRSDDSLIQQLVKSGSIDNQFSLCFGLVEGDGVLLLGESPALKDVSLTYTPLVESPTNGNYYTVNMGSIRVAGKTLDILPSTFHVGYSTVLDSGTTFTYIPSEAFSRFSEAVSSYAIARGLFSVPGPDPQYEDICFGGAPEHSDITGLRKVFPPVQFVFKDGVVLDLSPLNYLFVHTFESGKYCLGVFDNGDAGVLLGGITFRNVLVQYDLAKKRVGFGEASCKELGLRYRPSCSMFKTPGDEDSSVVLALADGDCEAEERDSGSDDDEFGEEEDSVQEEEVQVHDDIDAYEDTHAIIHQPSNVSTDYGKVDSRKVPSRPTKKNPQLPVMYEESTLDDAPQQEEFYDHIVSWVLLGSLMIVSLIATMILGVKKAMDVCARARYSSVSSEDRDNSNFTSMTTGGIHTVKMVEDLARKRGIQMSSPRESKDDSLRK